MWEILTARQFEILFMAHMQGTTYIDELRELMFTVYANFLGAGLVLGLLGILRNFLVDKERLLFLGLIFVAHLLFFAEGHGQTLHVCDRLSSLGHLDCRFT